MSAEFKVVKIDPEGSGMDFANHLGKIITDAWRCCKNCCIIFGKLGDTEIGPFVPGELEPQNAEAEQIQNEVLQQDVKTNSK